MAFKMKGHPLKRGLYMGAKSPYPKVMDQGKLGNQLKRFQNDLREAKDEKSKRKIKDMIEATMEEMQREGMSMEQIENIGGKSAFAKTGSPAKKNTYIVKMKDGTKKKMTREEYIKFTGKKPGSRM